MGRQLVTVGVGMGMMTRREGCTFLRVVGRVGMRMIHGVMTVLFNVTLLVLAGICPEVGLRIMGMWSWLVPWRHNQYSLCLLIK
jgi:hypothetical protein